MELLIETQGYMEGPNNGDLPADIILEILLRLPVKILLQFKRVCKQWYTLIGNPSFINQHFGHESNREWECFACFKDAVAILALDMSTEKFQAMQVPNCIKAGSVDLALYGDSIALLSCDLDKDDKCVDVWVLKKEGCWSKSLAVGPFNDNISWGQLQVLGPFF